MELRRVDYIELMIRREKWRVTLIVDLRCYKTFTVSYGGNRCLENASTGLERSPIEHKTISESIQKKRIGEF